MNIKYLVFIISKKDIGRFIFIFISVNKMSVEKKVII